MINRLPPELVRQIIESSVPSTYRYTTYDNRQTLLRSLCLVCHLFRDIAQPLLREIVYIDSELKSDALLTTLESSRCNGVVRQLIVRDGYEHDWDADFERILRSCQSLRNLSLRLACGGRSDLSVLQDLLHLEDLSLSGRDFQLPSCFKLHALTSLSIHHTAIEVAPTLLSPEVLPSLRSLVMFDIYDDDEIAYLNQSRLDDLLSQLEVLSLHSRIIQRGLNYLIPAYSRTLFDLYPPEDDDRIDLLQVAQHLRIDKKCNAKDVIRKFVVSIKNQHRQISLRSLYLDIGLEDLSAFPVDSDKAVQDLLRVCKAMKIEVIYEEPGGFAGNLSPSEEFGRRQRAFSNESEHQMINI